jgi:imidazolonepropionase-like amidohydrolase
MIALLAAAAAEAACGAVTGAKAHLPDKVAVVDVVWVDGVVAAVGADLPGLRSGQWAGGPCVVTDGAGKELTAGLVAVPTHLGLVEIDLEGGTHQDRGPGDDPLRATMVVVDGYDPSSSVLPVQRLQGLTGAVVVPAGGGPVAGVAGRVRLAGDTQAAAVVERTAAVVAQIPGGWGEGLAVWSGLLDDARAHAKDPAAYDRGRPYPVGMSRGDLEVLGRVVRGELPLLVGAQSAWQLEALLRWSKDEGVRVVIDGAAEGWLVAGPLAAAKVPVIVDPLVYGPGGFDQLRGRADNAALLAAAGVDVILSAHSTHNARTLRQVAGNAVRGGLDHEVALRAITSAPAAAFGAKKVGIAVGAPADLVVWTGDPLELSTLVVQNVIGGVAQELRSRQTGLLEKYRTLPGTPAPPLSLP